jgi:hypothetical protein
MMRASRLAPMWPPILSMPSLSYRSDISSSTAAGSCRRYLLVDLYLLEQTEADVLAENNWYA